MNWLVKRNKKAINRLSDFMKYIIATFILIYNKTVFLYAGSIQDSKFVTGTQQLLEDTTSVLLILAPIITVCVIGYCFIRKGAANEMDHKKWDTRISTALVSCIGVVSASIIVKIIMAYYE